MSEKTSPPGKTGRIIWICALALLLLAVIVLVAFSVHFGRTFLPGTTIAGVDCAALTAREAAERVMGAASQESITLRDLRGPEIVRFTVLDLLDSASLSNSVGEIFAAQHAEEGVFGWLRRSVRAYTPALFSGMTAESAEALLKTLIYNGEDPVAPRAAALEVREDGYTLREAVTGSTVDLEKCAVKLTALAHSLETVAPGEKLLSVANAMTLPEMTEESYSVRAQQRTLEEYLARTVTIDFCNGNVYTLTEEDICAASSVLLAKGTALCRPEREKVAALTESLIEQYASDGVDAKFGRAKETRDLIYYRVGDSGWRLDREALAEDVYAALCRAEGGEVRPDYDYTWYWNEYYGVGDTYLEISLDNQYEWYYLNGELLVETPVVTGCVANGDETRRGCFEIYYKVTDTYLSGATWYDHVDYWMPFDGNIGAHDSSWRDEYGGDIYLEDGSHGCINTPLEAMGTIYNNIWEGVPVIVY